MANSLFRNPISGEVKEVSKDEHWGMLAWKWIYIGDVPQSVEEPQTVKPHKHVQKGSK